MTPRCLVVVQTWKAMLAPRRLLATLVVAVPIMIVQQELGTTPWAGPMLAVLTLTLLAVAPIAYRMLLPLDVPRSQMPGRLLIYILLGGLSPLALYGLPMLLNIRPFVSTAPTLTVSLGLFWVAGYGLGRDIELEQRWEAERARSEGLAKAAETAQLMALRAQLDPHVLFNTLNAIAEWCRESPEVAEQALLDLSALLRQVLSGVRAETWTMKEELQLLRRYLELFKVRDPKKYGFEVDVDETLGGMEVPPMLLLPLAENAMTHGPGRGHRGITHVRVTRKQEQVVFTLDNPGRYSGRRPGGEGLSTVERRLDLAYGAQGVLHIEAHGERTVTRVRWPARPQATSEET